METPAVYDTWDSALKRVESLKAAGIWPGIIPVRVHDRVFAYRLTHDPHWGVDHEGNHGGLKAP